MSEPTIIKPTIGRRVWFWPAKNTGEAGFAYNDEAQPCDAGIAYVWSDTMINISVVDQNGVIHSRTSVPLIQAGQKAPEQGFYCEWMPYQQGQAKKAFDEGAANRLLAEKANLVYIVSDAASRASRLATAEGDVLARVLLEAAVDLMGASEPPEAKNALVEARNYADGTVASEPAPLRAASPLSNSAIEAEIQAKGLTAPRVTPADIEAVIGAEHSFTIGAALRALGHPTDEAFDLTTIVALKTTNDYTVYGKSACASPENFDAEVGRKIARADAVNQLWPLLGYELKSKLAHQAELRAALPQIHPEGMLPYNGAKTLFARPVTRGEYNAYRGWAAPQGEDQDVRGYLVEYADGGKSNDPRHQGYISWSPAEVFEKAYSRI